MLDISKRLFEKWNEESIIYCHWKSNEHLSEGLNGLTDLDVLLSRDSQEKGERILRELSFLKCKSQYGSRFPNVDDWIGFDEKTGALIHLHLHYRIITGHKGMKEYDLPWSNEVLKTRLKDNNTGVYVSDPNFELISLYTRIGLKADYISVLKAIANHFKLNKDVKAEIDYLKPKVNWECVDSVLYRYFKNNTSEFMCLMQKEQIRSNDLIKIKNLSSRALKTYRRVNFVRLKEVYYYFAIKFRSFLKKKLNWNYITKKTPSKKRGLVIAFIGQDGAGKSTVTEDIRKWLSWKLDSKRFYLGSGDHYHSWQKSLIRFIPNYGLTKPLYSFVRLSMYMSLAKDVYKTTKRANKYAQKGGIALFDRFPQTEFPGINDGPKIRIRIPNNRLIKPIGIRFADKEEAFLDQAITIAPDIVFKLVLPPEESVRRKPENKLENVRKKHEIIKKLHFPSSHVVEIDAVQDYQQELTRIKRIIWENIQKS